MQPSILRDAHWLTADRANAVCRVLLACWVALAASIPWAAPRMSVAHDFAAFWTAGRLALHGHAAAAYGAPERAALGSLLGPGAYAAFFYPPPALLLWAPFALLPFAAAASLWVATTAAAYVVALRALLPAALVPALAFPSVLVCALFGQNALLSAALFAAAAAALERRPLLAGVCLGCLAYKPQLAVLVPLALVAAQRWRAMLSFAATAAGLCVLSLLAFGGKSWVAFIAVLPEAQAWNGLGRPGFSTFASVYAAMRQLDRDAPAAWVAQTAVSSAAIVGLVIATRRRPGGAAEVASLVVATGFCTPFLGQYDLALFAVPGAWLVSEASRTGWLPYERSSLAALYLAPLAVVSGIPLAPATLAGLAALFWRRTYHRGGVLPLPNMPNTPRKNPGVSVASGFTPTFGSSNEPRTE
jgi:hypothetical protein